MRSNFKWILLFLYLVAIEAVFSCASDQNENQKIEKQPTLAEKTETKESNESVPEELELDDYGLEINGVKVEPIFGDELKVELDTIIFARERTRFGDSKLHPAKWSSNLKYSVYHGKICNNKLEPIFDNGVGINGSECGNEMGATLRILEDGTGFLSVCTGSYVRIDKYANKDFSLKKHATWKIMEEKIQNTAQIGRTAVGLTQDGRYLYKINSMNPHSESDRKVYYWVTKYDIIEEELIWTKKIEDPKSNEVWCISPDNKLIFTKGKTLVDENFNLLMNPTIYGTIEENRAIPQFFAYQGKQMLMVPSRKYVHFLNCADSTSLKKVHFRWIKYIQYCFVHKDQIIMQIVIVNGEKKLVTIPLDDPNKILIRPNTKNFVRGLDNKLVLADEKKFEVFKIVE